MLAMDDATFRKAAEQALARSAEADAKRKRIPPSDSRDWYIVRSVGKSDQQAIDGLKRLEIDTYYPQVIQMRKVPRRELSLAQRRSGIDIKRPRLGPLFPRYIFARFGMARDSWREVFRIVGVGGMLCEGDLPVKVSDHLIESIRMRESDGAVPGTEKTRLVFGVGETVTVTDGVFAAFAATVERGLDLPIEDIDPETRIKVAVNLFGRATPVELELWQVTKR